MVGERERAFEESEVRLTSKRSIRSFFRSKVGMKADRVSISDIDV